MERSCVTNLPLTVMLSPKNVQIPRDIVSDAMTVTTAVNPNPNLDRTSSILPEKQPTD